MVELSPDDVVVALSGGLDSSLAAALLKMAGWKIHGIHFMVPGPIQGTDARIDSARDIAGELEIPLKIMDLRKTFNKCVVRPFIKAYSNGLTPNPCVTCNEMIKFEYLRQYADLKGIRYLATGHYVRINREEGAPNVGLWRGRDRVKDQSYFLHRVKQACLSRTVFPLGEITKDESRQKAGELGLPVHGISESQEICFLQDEDYRVFLERQRNAGPSTAGKIINDYGEVLGEHAGIYMYTIGQRHGLGIASPRPYYVKELRPQTNEVVVGRKEDLYSTIVDVELFNWIEGSPCEGVMQALAQIRYRHRAAPGRLTVISPGRVRFVFDEPQLAVTPGQALVCYEGDRVIGGGWIKKT